MGQEGNTNVSSGFVCSREKTLQPTDPTIVELSARLRRVGETAPPRVAMLAAWLNERPEEIAFNSVRRLAERSGANANTVVRLSQSLGFQGYEACRNAFQDALRTSADSYYGRRAGELRQQERRAVLDNLEGAAHRNIEALFSPAGKAAIEEAADLLLAARQVRVIGVRSCFAIADYLTYTARMAFANFGRRAGTPGDIRDMIARTGPADVVMSITFPHYSVETIEAHELAQARGASTIAVTDGLHSPIAAGASLVLCPRMEGPQPLPSMLATFALAEAVVAAMIAKSKHAEANIVEFEERLLISGAYRKM